MLMNTLLLSAALVAAPAFAINPPDGTPPDGNPPAQDGAGKDRPAKGAGKGDGKGMRGAASGRMQGAMAGYRMFADALKSVESSFTPEQKQKIDGLRTDFEAKAKEFQPLMESMMQKMAEARKAAEGDPAAMQALKEEMEAIREKAPRPEEFQKSVMAALNADQQTTVKQKLEAIKKEMGERAGKGADGKRPGGPDGKRPGGPDGKRPGGPPPSDQPSDQPPPPKDKPVDFPE